jgi:hypothetical protein
VTDAKYLINVDFFEISRIHLNPEVYDIDPRCSTGIKDADAGGIVLTTEEEASRYLRKETILTFNSKPVTNLQKCKLCSNKPDYTL